MRLLLLTFGFGAVSAVIPVFNMEAYISVVHASSDTHSALVLAFAALEGVAGGRIPDGEQRLCDHAHGTGA